MGLIAIYDNFSKDYYEKISAVCTTGPRPVYKFTHDDVVFLKAQGLSIVEVIKE